MLNKSWDILLRFSFDFVCNSSVNSSNRLIFSLQEFVGDIDGAARYLFPCLIFSSQEFADHDIYVASPDRGHGPLTPSRT